MASFECFIDWVGRLLNADVSARVARRLEHEWRRLKVESRDEFVSLCFCEWLEDRSRFGKLSEDDALRGAWRAQKRLVRLANRTVSLASDQVVASVRNADPRKLAEDRDLMRRAFELASPDEAALLEMWLDGCTQHEIAMALEWSESKVSRHLRKLRDSLRSEM